MGLTYRPTWAEINIDHVKSNYINIRGLLKKETKFCGIIKANAYGHGVIPVSRTALGAGADSLAVAIPEEGIELRSAGFRVPILVLGLTLPQQAALFIDHDLTATVASSEGLQALQADALDKDRPCRVMIKLDTGMHRMGFDPENDMEELIGKLKHQNAIIPRSVFSHFVGSDDDSFDDFSAHQFELFDKGSKQLQAAFDHKILRHICNSAGIEHFPERQLDMCRLGLGLYGINSRNNKTINCVSTLKTTILQMHNVKAGDSVGYSRKTILDRDSVIAAIPIGYADGLNRRLGNRHAYCLVNGQKAEYVGNICMDVAMIDVTDIPCKEGDSVEIFGEHLPVQTLSDILETIPYEVLTTISNRVKRVYFQD